MTAWYVYLVRCADGTLYCGVTTRVERRVAEHNESPRGARYTRSRRPVVLVYSEPCEDRSAACQREYEIKRLSRADKEGLVQNVPVQHQKDEGFWIFGWALRIVLLAGMVAGCVLLARSCVWFNFSWM